MEVFPNIFVDLDTQSMDSIFDEFYNAIKQWNYEELERLLKKSDLTITPRLVYSPLHLAAELGDSKAIALLLRHGKCLTKAIYCSKEFGSKWLKLTPLLLAVKSGCIDAVEQLIDFGYQVDEVIMLQNDGCFTCLQSAVFMDNTEMVKTLLRRGAKTNNYDAINLSPLYMAIKNKNPDIVELLLQQGATIDYNNDLMREILDYSDMRIFEILLEHGHLIDVKNKEGENLLWLDVKCNKNKFLRLMVEYGFDPCQVTKGKTFLHIATQSENCEALKFFLKCDIDVNAYDYDFHGGQTAMHRLLSSIDRIRLPMIKELLLHGADPNIKDKRGNLTPLDDAVYTKYYWKKSFYPKDIDLNNCIELLLTAKTDYSDMLNKSKRSEYKDDYTKELFTKYFIKIKLCGLSVDERVNELFETPIEPRFQDECIEELKRLREIKVSKKFSLYDVLHAKYKGDLLALVELQKFHEVFESMTDKFPLYQNILLWRYISAKRHLFIGVARKNLDALCQSSLPILVIDRIVEHLPDFGKRRVIEAVTYENHK